MTLTFDALNRPDSSATSLAYWIGACRAEVLDGADAIGMTRAMSLQYDIEEQADRTGAVILDDVWWRGYFQPVAPVQLTRAWSPFPYAVDALGAPSWLSIEPDGLGRTAAACAWTIGNPGVFHPTASRVPDVARFRALLSVTHARARTESRAVLVIAIPGWSYDHVRPTGARARLLMRGAGFVVQDRRA